MLRWHRAPSGPGPTLAVQVRPRQPSGYTIVSKAVAATFTLVNNMAINTSFAREATLAETIPAPFLPVMWLAVRITELIKSSGTATEAFSMKDAIPSTPPAGVTPRRASRSRNRSRALDNLERTVPWGHATVDLPSRC